MMEPLAEIERAAGEDRVLLLLAHEPDRRLLAAYLEARHLMSASGPGAADFDLCILDSQSLERHQEWVRGVRAAARPLLLPFLLITGRQDVGMATRHIWESVDELIKSPVQKVELQARVEILLRARHLSLQNAALTQRLQAELARAGAVQAELLPHEPPLLQGFDLAARCVPARETGGDFYDWQVVAPGVLDVTVGDVMGKGTGAALLMATVRASLRTAAEASPAAVLERVRQALDADMERASSFVTLFHGRLDVRSGRLVYVDAGHGHCLVCRAGGAVDTLHRGGRPLGFPAESGYRESALTLHPGDALAVYSDGALESWQAAGLAPQALCERVLSAPTAAAVVDTLLPRVDPARPPGDDMTLLVLRATRIRPTG